MDNQIPVNKLILLYLIRQKENITPTELSDYIMFRGFMDYFSMENYLTELIETELVLPITGGDKTYYMLRSQGVEVVDMFRSRIPHSIREDIRSYAQNSFLNDSPLLETDAQIEHDGDQIQVCCRIMDYERCMLELWVDAENDEKAQQICNNWHQKGMSVYWNLLREIGGKKNDTVLRTEAGGNDADAGTERNL